MKKLLVSVFFAVLLALALPSGNEAEAAYNPELDVELRYYLPFDLPWLTEDLAWKMFDLQEAVHEYLRDNHDIDLEYGYIWVYLNDKLILAIDPPRYQINGEEMK